MRLLVAGATSSTEILRELGLDLHTNNFVKLRRRISLLGIDTSHFDRERAKHDGRRARWTDHDLRAAVASSSSYAETIRRLQLVPAGGTYDQVRRRIEALRLDTSHFRGSGWNVDGKYIKPVARPLDQVLVANRWTTTSKLKQRLIRARLKSASCELCGWAQRASDGRIPVELDHINGNKNDNRLENLRILCPNCHSLQPTHRGLNQKIAIDRRAARLARTEPKR